MSLSKCSFLLGVAIVFGLLLLPFSVLAEDKIKIIAPTLNIPIPGLDFTKYPIVRKTDSVAIPFLAVYISTIARYVLSIIVIVVAVMLVYGGFLYIVGSTFSDVQKGKEVIKDALIGLLLTLGSALMVGAVNPALSALKPLDVKIIPNQIYRNIVSNKDGVPVAMMKPWEAPVAAGTPSTPVATGGVTTENIGSGCFSGSPYKLPDSKCAGAAECDKLFCVNKNYSAIDNLPDMSSLAGFEDIFPPTVGEQISEKGLMFFAKQGMCVFSKKGCADSPSELRMAMFGSKASPARVNWMKGAMHFRPEVRDALVKAGAEAKARGYFLVIADGFRNIRDHVSVWCQRRAASGGSQGMASPGRSAHDIGIAVDISLNKMIDDGHYRQLTQVGSLCSQVSGQTGLGVENLKTLEEIMASAGFRHMCEEVWHFDYIGVNGSHADCTSCEFPGAMQTRMEKDGCHGAKKS